MATVYPAQLDTIITLPSATDKTTVVSATSPNTLRDAILAIEYAIGVNPASSYGTVASRLNTLEAAVNQGTTEDFVTWAGDLAGSSNTLQTVVGLQGFAVSTIPPISGQSIIWSGTAWTAGTNFGSQNIQTAGQLISGSLLSTSITSGLATLNGKIIVNGTSTSNTSGSGQGIIYFDSTQNKFLVSENNSSYVPLVSSDTNAGGDLTGIYPNPTVVKLQGNPVSTNSIAHDDYALVSQGGTWTPVGVAPVLNVKNYGAKGDGTTDDTSALQSAMTAANTLSASLFFPYGTYLLSQELTVGGGASGGVIIFGESHAYQTDVTTIKATASNMRSIFNVKGGYNKIRSMKLNANGNALYAVYRQEDVFSHYEDILTENAVLDGWHAADNLDGYSLSLVAHAGNTSPLITVAGVPLASRTIIVKILTTGGALGTAQYEYSTDNGSTYTSLATTPTTGTVQIADTINGSGNLYLGLQVTFPAGTYAINDYWTITSTVTSSNNDTSTIKDCWAVQNGTVYATSGVISNYTINNTTASASGTISISNGSQTITGSGTAFTRLNGTAGPIARVGDFLTIGGGGSIPKWTAKPWAPGSYCVANANKPGSAYIWGTSGGGTSSGAEPNWPTTGSVAGTSPIGTSITDGGNVVWSCVSSACFQIECVNDDTHITVGVRDCPGTTISGLDYAISIGHGYYEEPAASDNNLSSISGGLWRGNAGAGILCQGLYGPGIGGGGRIQMDGNGVCGISIGTDDNAHTTADTAISGLYSEGNYICGVFVASSNGLTIQSPITIDARTLQVFLANPYATGVQVTESGFVPIGANAVVTTLAGDVTGTSNYNNKVVGIQTFPVSPTTPAHDDFALVSSSGQYVPLGVAPVFNVRNYNAKGDGSTDDSGAFSSAATAATNGGIIHVPAAIYAIKSNLTLTGSYTVHFEPGAILKPSSSITITMRAIRGDIGQQLFDLSAGGKVTFQYPFSAPDNKMSVKWWGAKGDSVTDDSVAIQACLDAAFNVTSTTPGTPVPITYYDPHVVVFIPRGTYLVSTSTDTACLNMIDYLRLSGEQSVLQCNDTTKHILRIGAYFNIIENINFYSGKAAIICNGFSNHYDGYIGGVEAGANNIIRNCSFNYNAGPSIMLDTYGANRGSSASLIVDKCWFVTSCTYFGGFDGCTFRDCYITAAQAVDEDIYSIPVLDDDGYIMPVFANYDELVLEHCTMVPQADSASHGVWMKGVGSFSAHNTRFGGESGLVIARCQRKNFVYAGISVDTVADPLAFPQLHFDNCAMSSAADQNWLEIYDRFPARLSIKSAQQGTDTGTNQAPPQAPVLMMQSLGVWIDPITCPISSFLDTSQPYVVIDIDSQIDATGQDFRFRTSSNPLAITGNDTDITDKLQQYFVHPLKGGRASIGTAENYWPAAQVDLAHANGSASVGITTTTSDTTTGYTIQGYTANSFSGGFNELYCYFWNALPPSLAVGEYTFSMAIKATFSGQSAVYFSDYGNDSGEIVTDNLHFAGGGQWQRVATTFYYDGYAFDGTAGRGITVAFTDVPLGGNFWCGLFALHRGRDVKSWTYPNNANSQDLVVSEYWASAQPSSGTYKTADIVWNTAPADGYAAAWICVSSGSPGTFGVVPILGNTTSSATAGSNGDVPAQVVGYLELLINGAIYKIPYYNV